MAVNFYPGSSRNRIEGMFSGMDTGSLVQSMMKIEQMKIDKVDSEKTRLTWKKDALNDVLAQVNSVRNTYMSTLSDKNIFSLKAYLSKGVSMEKNAYFDLEATSSALLGNYSVSEVKVGKNAQLSSDAALNTRSSERLGTSAGYMKAVVSAEFSKGTVDGGSVEGTTELGKIAVADGSALVEGDKTIGFTVNGVQFAFGAEDTIDDVVAKINTDMQKEQSSNRVKASFANGELKFESESNTKDAQIKVKNTLGNFIGTDGAIQMAETTKATNQLDMGTMTLEHMMEMSGSKDLFGDISGGGKGVKFSINGKSFEFSKDTTMETVMNAVNSDTTANVKMSYDDTLGNFTVRSKKNGPGTQVELKNDVGSFFGQTEKSIVAVSEGKSTSYASIKNTDTLVDIARKTGKDLTSIKDATSGKIEFSINGEDFSFDEGDTLAQINSKISSSGTGVQLQYSELSDKFIISANNMGDDAKVEISGAGLELLGMQAGVNVGSNSFATINGEKYESTGNTFTVDGMSFTLKKDMAAGSSTVDFRITQDSSDVVGKVKEFVTEYNKMVDSINTALSERKSYKFKPLTAEERSSMTEKEVEAWDAETKKGTLYNDPMVLALRDQMRSALSSIIVTDEEGGGAGVTAASIGLKGVTYDVNRSMGGLGKIEFDEATFTKALQEDPDRVASLMVNVSTSTDKAQNKKESGIVSRLMDSMSGFAKNVRNEILGDRNLDYKLRSADEKMDELRAKMYYKEEALWAKFAKLETVMSKMQAQQSWLGSQLGM